MASPSNSGGTTPATQYCADEEQLIQRALSVLEQRVFQHGPLLNSSQDVRHYLRLKLAGEPNEVFAVLFLDTQHQVLAFEPMFHGTVNGTTVHMRQILQRVLDHNSAAVIIVHNHPSGSVAPSQADRFLTTALSQLLSSIDVQLLDHFIVGEGEPFSFQEAGLL